MTKLVRTSSPHPLAGYYSSPPRHTLQPSGNQKKQFDAIIAKRPPPKQKDTEEEAALIHNLTVASNGVNPSPHRPWWLGCCPCVGGN